jgi:hypothetical protein
MRFGHPEYAAELIENAGQLVSVIWSLGGRFPLQSPARVLRALFHAESLSASSFVRLWDQGNYTILPYRPLPFWWVIAGQNGADEQG